MTAIREAAPFVAQNPEQSARWFGEQLRLDADTVRRVSAENPLLHGVSKIEDVRVEPSPELRAFAAKRVGELVASASTHAIARISKA